MKRIFSFFLMVVLLFSFSMSACAAAPATGFSDVSADAWYADAVTYVQQHGLMNGTGANTFSPNAVTSRGQIAAILYRAAGSPAVSGGTQFPDVASTAYYADAARWASANGIVSGYANGNFGPNDPITRQQLASILWRYAGSPAAERGQDFADESAISAYASTAVDWARANGIISGMDSNRFDPNGNTTRAQAAVILRGYMERGTAEQPGTSAESRVLVAYFSATGNTESVAETIADTLDADLFELTTADPYTAEDLDWTAEGSRVNLEHENEALRNVELTADTVAGWEEYDTVFIGYPIWWGIAAWPVNDFIQSNDFTGKTVIPFCTSASSGLGQSGELLEQMAGTGNWLEGRRFTGRASEADIQDWLDSLNLHTDSEAPAPQESRVLVTYFSMPETTDPNNMTTEEDNSVVVIDGEVLGNTQYMAYVIQETTNADIFRIEPQTPYPTDHSTLVELAAEEQDENARPAIQGQVNNIEDYDVIFIGYPIWWSDMPMILYSFFDTYDLSGKTIIPFSTHGGSSFAGTPRTIAELEPNAEILDGLTISRNRIQDARQEIVDWVNALDF